MDSVQHEYRSSTILPSRAVWPVDDFSAVYVKAKEVSKGDRHLTICIASNGCNRNWRFKAARLCNSEVTLLDYRGLGALIGSNK